MLLAPSFTSNEIKKGLSGELRTDDDDGGSVDHTVMSVLHRLERFCSHSSGRLVRGRRLRVQMEDLVHDLPLSIDFEKGE